MVSIVISEKGGAERKERFDTPEISIGRVKGNDVLLPKGNVSKRHARLIQRDGRFIVTDLKSTNGTYVNHRRITHATLVREGDRIYIGDFVLWIESDQAGAIPAATPSSPYEEPDSPPSDEAFPGIVPGALDSVSSSGSFDSRLGLTGPVEGVVSHFPIEHDPDESAPLYEVPSPPRMPGGLRQSGSGSYPALDPTSSQEALASQLNPPSEVPTAGLEADSAPVVPRHSSTPSLDRQSLAARQACLDALVTAVEQDAELAAKLDGPEPPSEVLATQARQAVDAELAKLLQSSSLPEDLDEATLRDAAVRELLELGPLGPLLDDEMTSQVQVILRQVVTTRRGRRTTSGSLGFSSERAVARALQRLCAQVDGPIGADELYVKRFLPEGRELFAVRPPASKRGHLLVVSKAQRSPVTLNTLVRSGTISRGMATLLGHCVAAKVNVLVVGSRGSGTGRLVDALAASIPDHDRTVWLCEGHTADLVPEGAAVVELGDTAKSRLAAIEAAAQLQPEHLVVPPLAGEGLAAVLDVVTQGTEGVIMHVHASTLRHAVGRLGADLARARPGLPVDAAREWLTAAFDIGLEVARLRDERQRVTRLSEFRGGSKGAGLKDVFTFAYHRTATGGSIEGSFYPTGTVPHIVEDLAARGLPLDSSIFRRHPSG